MADITVRKNTENQATQQQPLSGFEPFRAMRELLRWDPFQQMTPLWPAQPDGFAPAFEVKETHDAYVFEADVPGVKESDIEITVTGNRLTISGHRIEEKEDKNTTYYSCERQYGSFQRSYTLPEGADTEHVHASLKAGVLSVGVPKKPELQPKKIAVKSAAMKT
jgi:HSP20 family protein